MSKIMSDLRRSKRNQPVQGSKAIKNTASDDHVRRKSYVICDDMTCEVFSNPARLDKVKGLLFSESRNYNQQIYT